MFSRPILRSLAPRTLKAPQQPSASILSRFSRFQQRDLSQQAKDAIDDAIKASPLVVFMKGNPAQPQCGFSRAVVQILDVQGVPMEKMHTYNCLDDQELREGIKEYSDWPTIPQVYLKGEFLGGCDILMGMHSSGELEELLVKEGIISLEEELSDGSAEPEKKD